MAWKIHSVQKIEPAVEPFHIEQLNK
jgi:hypothetical protein